MPSDSESRQSIDNLLNLRMGSLNDILGPDWKQRSIHNSVAESLKSEGINDFSEAKVIDPENGNTETERFSILLNTIFTQRGDHIEARVYTDSKGKQKTLILGQLGEDVVYQTVRYFDVVDDNNFGFCPVWIPDHFGLISKNGQVFRIDEAIKPVLTDDFKDMVFMEINSETTYDVPFSQGGDSITSLPRNYVDVSTITHEMGHSLRYQKVAKDKRDVSMDNRMRAEFKKSGEHSKDDQNEFTSSEVRQITANNERTAWAIGISLLREVGREIGLRSASGETVKQIVDHAQWALKTYDDQPYIIEPEDTHDHKIPAFSSKVRRAAQQLHQIIKDKNMKYLDLKKFDVQTGESLANDPQELIDMNNLDK